ncbi:MAG: hypothetical protein RMX68_008930 [Aulosira sp. ZfuVER01]|nr:hypothetical protein [Aulosira sp. ZfuVER01]MDZ7998678.1 hypothetical protein [Aulosira sp. DedVER01a]MDZ8054850.1 hypothetical protein [Aulosira sp. ZfuCHP01]
MLGLQISDLSFCEAVSGNQVKGGLTAEEKHDDILGLLTTNIPGFVKKNQTEQAEYLVEEFSNENGEIRGYRISSKDGKEKFGGAKGRINGNEYTAAFASVKS